MDILYLVGRLENLISSSRRMPLVNQILVKEGDILSIIDEMRNSIPEEIKHARRLLQERERILAQAQQEASTILARAKEDSERALSREGLLHAAEERSQELMRRATEHSQDLVRRAEAHTEQLKADADAYAAETLRNLKEHLMSIQTEVDRTIFSIERGLESLETQQEQGELRNHQESVEYIEDLDDTRDELPPSSSYPTPRRASLAADTMGGPPPQ